MKQRDHSGARSVETAGRGQCLLIIAVLGLSALLASCAGTHSPAGSRSGVGIGEASPDAPAPRATGRRGSGGGYYLDDGPGDSPPPDLDAIADAVPWPEPVLARASRPYVVFGRQYQPMTQLEPYRARGIATWYGRRYHGNPTSSGERYDMYAMTAAHPTLPIPSYVRVTSVRNGRSVVLRVNDRGPFLSNRLIDLSYTAAAKLGYVGSGSAEVDVELITEFGAPPARALASASRSESAVSAAGPLALVAAAPTAQASSLAAPAPAAPSIALAPSAPAPPPLAPGVPAPAPAAQPLALGTATTAAAGEAAEAPMERLTVETDIHEQAVEVAAAPNEPARIAGARASPAPAPIPTTTTTTTTTTTATATARAAGSLAALVPMLDRTFWLQLGAFGSPENAHAARERLMRQLAGLGAPLDVVADGGLYKLQAGPWPTRDAALAAGQRVRSTTELKPFAMQR